MYMPNSCDDTRASGIMIRHVSARRIPSRSATKRADVSTWLCDRVTVCTPDGLARVSRSHTIVAGDVPSTFTSDEMMRDLSSYTGPVFRKCTHGITSNGTSVKSGPCASSTTTMRMPLRLFLHFRTSEASACLVSTNSTTGLMASTMSPMGMSNGRKEHTPPHSQLDTQNTTLSGRGAVRVHTVKPRAKRRIWNEPATWHTVLQYCRHEVSCHVPPVSVRV
mmetsp:Transcript_3516/g.8454  ORF Transcript_3516/g.8454 Transcript_3516/m.8454 type:complete len:221 (-) Transcript_3516:1056-1718(-)